MHIGARVSALAGPNDVLVSSTLRDLAVIAGIRPGLAPVLPLVIDLAIGVATLALVAIGDKPARRTRSARATAAPSAITATSKRDIPTATPTSRAMTDRDNATASHTESATSSADDPTRELAAVLVAEKLTRQPVELVARILVAHDSGDPVNRIAKNVGVHHSAVSRVIAAAAAPRQRTLEVA